MVNGSINKKFITIYNLTNFEVNFAFYYFVVLKLSSKNAIIRGFVNLLQGFPKWAKWAKWPPWGPFEEVRGP